MRIRLENQSHLIHYKGFLIDMSLDNFFDEPVVEQTILEKIRQRRSQMLIHSCVYYELNDNIVSDDKWQEWAEELDRLQKQNPKLLKMNFYDSYFKDWDGTTGGHLPHRDQWVYWKATRLLKYMNENK